jgi:saccharopine dehydrogenase-like NADP-dependent oxidoreductase
MMHELLLLGAGKIGRMIVALLSDTGDYRITVGDADHKRLARVSACPQVVTLELDASDRDSLARALKGRETVISALSYRFNPLVAKLAREAGLSYLDLTEDVETTRQVSAIAASSARDQFFAPQCGLAPGYVSILASHIMRAFEVVDSVQMRVGALPQFPSNSLAYNLTWSTDGLINEYCNPCEAIRNGERVTLAPLEGLEHLWLHGVRYEAFSTSGGSGSLCDTLAGRVRELDYKTIRYPGHRHLMSFLVNDLRLNERRDVLKDVLEQAVPVTFQDMVVVFCTVTGRRRDQLVQLSEVRRIYSRQMHGEQWSAIQITTAAGVCAVLDLALGGRIERTGLIRQEQVDLGEFERNRFGRHLRDATPLQEEKEP